MPIDLYYLPGSAPCRSVLLAAKALGLELNLKPTNLMEGEHLKPEYIKMNPQHTIPTINDDGFALWESRAILGYLVDQYGKDDTLYPKDPKKRALVDQRLYFDATNLYQRFGDYYYPIAFANAPADPAKYVKIEESFAFLNTFLDGQTWAAGSNLTIADLALVASVSTYDALDFPVKNYANVQAWYERVQKKAPGYEVNASGVAAFKELFQGLVNKNKK